MLQPRKIASIKGAAHQDRLELPRAGGIFHVFVSLNDEWNPDKSLSAGAIFLF
jgi:hypothetical protein